MKKTTLIFSLMMIAFLFAQQVVAQTFKVKNQSIDLRSKINEYGLKVRDQAPRGTCTIFATTFLIEYFKSRETNAKNLDFSEEYLNSVANLATGNGYDGADFDEAISGFEEFGIVNEQSAPYKIAFDSKYLMGNDAAMLDLLGLGKANRGYEGTVSVSANVPNGLPGLSDAQLVALVNELDKGNPVAIGHGGDASANTTTVKLANGFTAYDNFNINKLINPYVHTVPLVGYQIDSKIPGGGYFVFRNSGGESWGDKGYGYMTFKYAKNFTYDTLIMKRAALAMIQGRSNLELIEKQFLLRKDILRQNTKRLKLVKAPFLSTENLRRMDEFTKNK